MIGLFIRDHRARTRVASGASPSTPDPNAVIIDEAGMPGGDLDGYSLRRAREMHLGAATGRRGLLFDYGMKGRQHTCDPPWHRAFAHIWIDVGGVTRVKGGDNRRMPVSEPPR